MKSIINLFSVAVLSIVLVGCASQNNQATNNNQRPQQNGQRGGQQGGQRGTPPSFDQMLSEMDANNDGKLSKGEVKGRLAEDFDNVDTDNDGFITESELENAPRPQRGQRQ